MPKAKIAPFVLKHAIAGDKIDRNTPFRSRIRKRRKSELRARCWAQNRKMSTSGTIVTPMLSYKQTYAPHPSPVPRLEDLEDQVHVHPPHLLEGLGARHRVEVREHERQALLP